MLKILIDNEEVVCDNMLTIKEEMLQTSSTILNNCYPKSWEIDKDYVNRYYYPKDYSKCLIYNSEKDNTTEEKTGETITFDTIVNKSTIEDFKIYGNCEQETRSGKNLWKLPKTETSNGVTLTNNGDGTITLNGTATANADFYVKDNSSNYINGEKYYISSNINKSDVMIIIANYNGDTYVNTMINSNGTMPFTMNTTNDQVRLIIRALSGKTFNNTKLQIQMEKGSTSTEFEPYGAMPSPDFPSDIKTVGIKNLFDKNDFNELNGFFHNDTGSSINANENRKTIYIECKPNTTYTITSAFIPTAVNQFSVGYTSKTPKIGSGIVDYKISTINKTNTITTADNTKYLIVYCYSSTYNLTYNDILNSIQIEEGSVSHDYVPYGNWLKVYNKGKNFINELEIGGINTDNGSDTSNATRKRTKYIKISPNTKYSLSSNINTWRWGILYDINKNFISSIQWSTNTEYTFTTPNNAYYFREYLGAVGDIEIKDINEQLELGDPTPYEPYKEDSYLIDLRDNELCKIGNIQDELDITTGVLTKRIGKVVLDGSENWKKSSTTSLDRYYIDLFDGILPDYRSEIAKSSHFKYQYGGGIGNFLLDKYQQTTRLFMDYATYNSTTLANFKTWLSNNPVEVYYILETPEIIQLDSTNIVINDTTTTLSCESQATPTLYAKVFTNYEELIFAGIVKNTGNISLNPREPHYCSLEILDFKTLLSEGETLDFVINNKTVSEAIEQVIEKITDYGFILGNIQIMGADEVIGAYSTLEKTPYDVFQYLSDITQSKWYTRMIDENTVAIDFYDPTLMKIGTQLLSNEEYWEENEIIDITFNYSTRDYRNKQIMLSDQVYSNLEQQENKIADGFNKTYMTDYNIGYINSITVDGEERTFITKTQRDDGLIGDFYYNPGENMVESEIIISYGSIIEISYIPFVKGRQIINNNIEISRIQNNINRKGIISRYENRNDVLSSEELEKIGESYIRYKGNAEITLTVITLKNLWEIGNVVQFDSVLEELTTDYMVKSKEIEIIPSVNRIQYTYELSSNYNSENAINYFDNQRTKAKGNISEGETITRNIDIENSANIIFYDLSIREITIENNNILDNVLDSPFNN